MHTSLVKSEDGIGHKKLLKYPFEWAIWYPDGNVRTNWYTHTLIVFFFQTLPAYFVDFIFLCLFMERLVIESRIIGKNSWKIEIPAPFCRSLLGRHPNCYTFSKALSEAVVAEFAGKNIPICIMRPGIVTPAFKDPFPGWVDSLNGPIGVLVASGKGVLRSMMCNEKYGAEVIPVDVCINLVIAAAHARAQMPRQLREVPVYNACTGSKDRTTWRQVIEIGHKKLLKYPFEWAIWYPDGNVRTNWYTHNLIVFFFQTLPAYFVDFIFLCLFMERFMVRVQKKIHSGSELLAFFTMREWIIDNDAAWSLWKMLNPRDQETFFCNNILPVDKDAYLDSVVFGARTYCMKEPVSSLKACRRRITVQYFLHRICVALFYMYAVYLALQVFGYFAGDVSSYLPLAMSPPLTSRTGQGV
ncbi:putative fatty acyl-CoA reductase CG5065 [Frankliniella occidentalis]|uniref:Fatty acyl-CoA reductase n=1 Tax=Frankliniella occidentalis TaxID=133901 RepID=A0A9C6XRX2_FRAOC|nr:putative fatty acyl-CoA reductase CG5065 [Frankliniella occidentalis]